MIGLYIHVPFCVQKCKYCDFVSYHYDADLAASYVCALLKEIELYRQILSDDKKKLASLYIGGGTPSLLSVAQLEALFGATGNAFQYDTGWEATIEVNPGTVEQEKLKALRSLGCNRLSIGVQSANPRLLQCLGRIHSVQEAEKAIGMARRAGFTNINVDLIFGIPGQDLDDWKRTLAWTLSFRPEHISAYSLKIEEGTPFARMAAAGEIAPINEEDDLAMFLYLIDKLKSAGYQHYEISNFCLPGMESVHNGRYWANGEYLGLGPAAHSYIDKCRFHNEAALDKYCAALKTGKAPVMESVEITLKEEISETIFLALRMLKGLNLAEFRRRFGKTIEELFPAELDKLERLELIEKKDGFLRLTRRGLPLANEVFAEFV